MPTFCALNTADYRAFIEVLVEPLLKTLPGIQSSGWHSHGRGSRDTYHIYLIENLVVDLDIYTNPETQRIHYHTFVMRKVPDQLGWYTDTRGFISKAGSQEISQIITWVIQSLSRDNHYKLLLRTQKLNRILHANLSSIP